MGRGSDLTPGFRVNTNRIPVGRLPERDPVRRCRSCGYLYYLVKLPIHEEICSRKVCSRASAIAGLELCSSTFPRDGAEPGFPTRNPSHGESLRAPYRLARSSTRIRKSTGPSSSLNSTLWVCLWFLPSAGNVKTGFLSL